MPEPQPPSTRDGSGPGRSRSRRRLRSVSETSAGGLVVDSVDAATRAVLIGRIDHAGELEWVLPKGHLEAGETAEDAAVREIREETGLTARIVAPLGPIDYWFMAKKNRIHKTVHHFVLEVVDGELGSDDLEVCEIAWFALGELDSQLRYPSERTLVRRLPELVTVGHKDGLT